MIHGDNPMVQLIWIELQIVDMAVVGSNPLIHRVTIYAFVAHVATHVKK
jgi:hypothetical protein